MKYRNKTLFKIRLMRIEITLRHDNDSKLVLIEFKEGNLPRKVILLSYHFMLPVNI